MGSCSVFFRAFSVLPVFATGLVGCAAVAPRALVDSAAPVASCSRSQGDGNLVVYSTTYPQTAEQSEYPAHTNYTIATTDGRVLRRVANNAGPFGAFPSSVELPCGDYDVRAQYGSGRFVVVPVAVRAGKITVVELTHEPVELGAGLIREPIRLPSGQVVGWRATGG
jgi:hypothetical protein